MAKANLNCQIKLTKEPKGYIIYNVSAPKTLKLETFEHRTNQNNVHQPTFTKKIK